MKGLAVGMLVIALVITMYLLVGYAVYLVYPPDNPDIGALEGSVISAFAAVVVSVVALIVVGFATVLGNWVISLWEDN